MDQNPSLKGDNINTSKLCSANFLALGKFFHHPSEDLSLLLSF